MTISCLNVIHDLNKAVDRANTDLIDNMTDEDMNYDLICIKPNVTYDNFFGSLKHVWEKIINEFINQPDSCSTIMQWISLYEYADPAKLEQFKKMIEAASQRMPGEIIQGVDIENIVLDVVASSIINQKGSDTFVVYTGAKKTIINLAQVLVDHCSCQLVDIFKVFVKKYKKKYYIKFQNKTKDQVIEILRNDYNDFKDIIRNIYYSDNTWNQGFLFVGNITNKLMGIHKFTIESELNKLIPDELGSLKEFFIRIISKYYNDLHPIIWAQIFKNMTENIFVELPFTYNEIFAFVAKYLLLNSGPFILKILQMISPLLSKELKRKYNLERLSYPLMKSKQVELILSKVVNNWEMYKILNNISASVGHVCIVIRAERPNEPFIIKIIKPLAIAQTCWEYKTLYDIFGENEQCERNFVKNMLESTGKELNIKNEIQNIIKGYEYYTANYSDVFGADIDAQLTTVQNIPDIIEPNAWFALTMTMAPGFPLSRLLEPSEHINLKTDNIFRAKLHRCLDLLAYKFFSNLIQNGFYHGDLHSGNIFFSYDKSTITLIDFGAVGHIEIFNNDDPSIKALLEIIVMSIFYNYDEILDKMTVLLNSKCPGKIIDISSVEYKNFRDTLSRHKINNIRNSKIEEEKEKQYEKDIFSDKRVQDENTGNLEKINTKTGIVTYIPVMYTAQLHEEIEADTSVYSYLEIKPRTSETIIEYRNELPQFTEILGETESATFASILKEIIEFYAKSGVNIAIKFSDFYDLQKAYLLLLGVLNKVGYNSYRLGIVINKAIKNWKNIPKLANIGTTADIIKIYTREWNKYKKINNNLNKILINQQTSEPIIMQNISTEQIIELSFPTIDPNDPEDIEQYGGSNNVDYLYKYVKYRTKYHQLKR